MTCSIDLMLQQCFCCFSTIGFNSVDDLQEDAYILYLLPGQPYGLFTREWLVTKQCVQFWCCHAFTVSYYPLGLGYTNLKIVLLIEQQLITLFIESLSKLNTQQFVFITCSTFLLPKFYKKNHTLNNNSHDTIGHQRS